MATRTKDKDDRASATLAQRTPILEWAAAAVGLVLTLGAVGYLAIESLQPDNGPPILVARADAPVRTSGGYFVSVRVENQGRATAADVEVEGVLRSGNGEEERSAITLDYLAGGGVRRGGLIFQADPRIGDLRVTARGHVDP